MMGISWVELVVIVLVARRFWDFALRAVRRGQHSASMPLTAFLRVRACIQSERNYAAFSVVGSIIFRTRVMLVAGKPLISACLRIVSSSLARYTQKVLSAATKLSTHWMSGASWARAWLDSAAAPASCSHSMEPTEGISRSIR